MKASVPWGELGASVIGLAKNGLEAYEMIARERPEIVFADIKMPGLDGLELIAKVRGELPETIFIVVSGYDEFQYAKTAMQCGVKHYLLKPCDEGQIQQVLREVIQEIEQRRTREAYIRKIREDFERILPQTRGKVLRDFATDSNYGAREWEYYRSLFGLEFETDKFRLIIFQMEGAFDFESLFALRKLAEEVIGEKNPYLSTYIGEQVVILIGDIGLEKTLDLARTVKRSFFGYYERDLTIAVSEADEIESLQTLYRETKDYLKYRFYLGEGSIITRKDVAEDQGAAPTLVYDFERVGVLARSGDVPGLRREIDDFFARLRAIAGDFSRAKTYCLDLLLAIIRQGPQDTLDDRVKNLLRLAEMGTLDQIRAYVMQTALEIAEANFRQQKQRYSGQIEKVIQLVREHLSEEDLSLRWLAQEMLYMNVDYLGKLFKKEMNERFTDYLLRMRMDKAREYLEDSGDRKVFEIAELVGFGKNTQYFSQVFKRYFGCTPTEYKKRPL